MAFIGEAATGSPEITSKPPSIKRKYVVSGYPNEMLAKAAVAAATQATDVVYSDLNKPCLVYKGDITLSRVGNANDVWEANVYWGLKTFPVTFDTSGQSVKVTQSIQTKGIYFGQVEDVDPNTQQIILRQATQEELDFKGGIGFNGESFDGIDVTIPQFAWTETITFQTEQVNWQYINILVGLTGRTNAAAFRGFAPGEVLFLGASGGSQKNETECDIQFKFSAGPNVEDITIGDIEGISKQAWDYLWVYYQDQTFNSKKRIKRPVGAFVEQVYYPGDFSLLGIGE